MSQPPDIPDFPALPPDDYVPQDPGPQAEAGEWSMPSGAPVGGADNRAVARRGNRNRRNNRNEGGGLEFMKLPPQARELEEAVLGAMLIDKDAVSTIIDVLRPEAFYVEGHKHIYEAIFHLFNESEPVDILTVTERLRRMGVLDLVGGAYAVAELSNKVTSAANVEHHARIVVQKYIQRELIRVSTSIIQDAYEDTTDVLELLDRSEQSLYEVAETNLRRGFDDMKTLVSKAIKEIDEVRKHDNSLTGIPSGFTSLDRLTAGWQRSDLIIVAARPGMGKTAFTLAVARNAAVDFNKGVAIFSLEMSSVQLVKRLISMETELTGEKIRRGDLAEHEWIQLTKLTGGLAEAPIYIDDTPAINIFELRAKCRRLKSDKNIELIVIDYLQLMSGTPNGKAGNREQEISTISRSLKAIAKELDVPVIALSQLSRAVETRGGEKRPQLSDLRESGAIEQDADIVTFLYRPEYYGFDQDEQGNPTNGMADIIVAKHRNGALDDVRVRFVAKYAKFQDAEGFDFAPPAPGAFGGAPMELSGGPMFGEESTPMPPSGGGNMTPLSQHLDDPAAGIIKRSSRMDDMGDDGTGDEDMPF